MSGQISLEYLIVVSFVVFVVIGLVGVAIFYTSGAKDKLRVNQLSNFANKLITSAESVYFAGEPSKVTITAYLPGGVESFEVLENSLLFGIRTDSGLTITSFPSDVPLNNVITFSLGEGVKRLRILASSDKVFINEV